MKNILMKFLRYIVNPNYRFLVNARKGAYDSLPDEEFLRRLYKAKLNEELNLDNPRTFGEKIQWLKLNDRKPEYTIYVDKYKVRDYIAQVLGEEFLIPLIGVWDNPEDINFDELPNQFVLKCNHNSGLGMCICKDKTKLDINHTMSELKKGINENYYLKNREWPYKNVPRKIIAEKFMSDNSGSDLKDYKFFCFDGKVMYCQIIADRSSKETIDFYDCKWQKQDFIGLNPNVSHSIKEHKKPALYDDMVKYAEILSKGFKFIRIDFYNINSKIYFGEMTFYPYSGFGVFTPEEWNYKMGDLIRI